MREIQFENDQFILYSPSSLKYITDSMSDILTKAFNFYEELFGINNFRKVQINYFDDIQVFRSFIHNLRGNESLPDYARGTFDKGMINSYLDPNTDINSPKCHKALYMASHELFHIMYKELVWGKGKNRIVWFDEGMAQLFSGENDENLSGDNFNEWFNNIVDKTLEIPDLNNLKHGTSFQNEKYNGYDLSLLAVKFLYETLEIDGFRSLMHDNDKITEYGGTVLEDAINYYQNKLSNTRTL